MSDTLSPFVFNATGYPPVEGRRLADELVARGDDPRDVEVDLTGCASAVLITAFFNAFLQRVHETRPEWLAAARQVKFVLKYDFQQREAARCLERFEPRDA